MISLIARIFAGIFTAAAVVTVGYKLLTPEKAKEEINATLRDRDLEVFKKAFAAKVKEKMSESITVDVLDEWDEMMMSDVVVECDEVSDDIHVGDIISLVD